MGDFLAVDQSTTVHLHLYNEVVLLSSYPLFIIHLFLVFLRLLCFLLSSFLPVCFIFLLLYFSRDVIFSNFLKFASALFFHALKMSIVPFFRHFYQLARFFFLGKIPEELVLILIHNYEENMIKKTISQVCIVDFLAVDRSTKTFCFFPQWNLFIITIFFFVLKLLHLYSFY